LSSTEWLRQRGRLRRVATDRAGAVEREPARVVAAVVGLQRVRGREPRRLGDDVDRSAGFAAAVEGAHRSLEELEPFDVGGVARRVEAAVGADAVAQQRHARVAMAGEAAQRDVVPDAAEVVLPAGAGDEVQRIIHAQRAEVVEQLARHDAHRLRHLEQGRVGLGGAGGMGVMVGTRLASSDHLHGRQGLFGRRRGRGVGATRWFRGLCQGRHRRGGHEHGGGAAREAPARETMVHLGKSSGIVVVARPADVRMAAAPEHKQEPLSSRSTESNAAAAIERRSSRQPRQGGRADVEAQAEDGVVGKAAQAILERRRGP
jgi:hypothetical protein